tara:strand:- start:1466 stop:1930 length:465 start_codon:yes stop_codon:yes gene_type:complete
MSSLVSKKLSLIDPRDLEKLVENPNNNYLSMFDVGIRFPFATCKTYVLPYTTVINSDFVKNILSCDLDSEEVERIKTPKYKEIEIPLSLYKNMRETDLDLYFDLWKGKETVASATSIGQYNLRAMAEFTRAILMNDSIYFVQYLENKFPYKPDN